MNNETICFYQGREAIGGSSPIEVIKQKVVELSGMRNVSFLLGAGTSSGAIPNMRMLYDEITSEIKSDQVLSSVEKKVYLSVAGNNLENILSALYARQFYLQRIVPPPPTDGSQEGIENPSLLESVTIVINYIEKKIFEKINIDFSSELSQENLDLYKTLYQKVALRNKDLSRINVFTTNNDLFNEKALDDLNINYNNGFGGGLDRYFNPARFSYTFSKKIDPNLEKFEPLENMAYLYKLHGSISWIETEGNSLFNIKEVPVSGGVSKSSSQHVLIYPTPLKQNQSLGSPYSDLMREFKVKLAQPNSVIFIIGYSFSDEHINNIIYQSLASNSSISVVIFGDYPNCPLSNINDSRIYRIFGEDCSGQKIHYFKYIVNDLLPSLDEKKDKSLLDEFVNALKVQSSGGSQG
ncbi:SIR2 family protein [Aurantivibrio infirmus]